MTTTSLPPSTTPRSGRLAGLAPVAVAWLFVVFDGYDLIVYGTVQKLLGEEWQLSPAQLGTLGSMAFLGMMAGALVAGRLSDAIGRKNAIIGCAVVLSVFTTLCAVSHAPWLFGLFRFLAGLGLGAWSRRRTRSPPTASRGAGGPPSPRS
nr:MFS transporter [Xylanimonas allomyrinae]